MITVLDSEELVAYRLPDGSSTRFKAGRLVRILFVPTRGPHLQGDVELRYESGVVTEFRCERVSDFHIALERINRQVADLFAADDPELNFIHDFVYEEGQEVPDRYDLFEKIRQLREANARTQR